MRRPRRLLVRSGPLSAIPGGVEQPYLPPVPASMPQSAWGEWLARIARTLNEAIFGNINVVLDVTLAVDPAIETVVTDSRIGVFSVVLAMPLSASAGPVWIEPGAGQAVIHHAADVATDRHYRLAIFG